MEPNRSARIQWRRQASCRTPGPRGGWQPDTRSASPREHRGYPLASTRFFLCNDQPVALQGFACHRTLYRRAARRARSPRGCRTATPRGSCCRFFARRGRCSATASAGRSAEPGLNLSNTACTCSHQQANCLFNSLSNQNWLCIAMQACHDLLRAPHARAVPKPFQTGLPRGPRAQLGLSRRLPFPLAFPEQHSSRSFADFLEVCALGRTPRDQAAHR